MLKKGRNECNSRDMNCWKRMPSLMYMPVLLIGKCNRLCLFVLAVVSGVVFRDSVMNNLEILVCIIYV